MEKTVLGHFALFRLSEAFWALPAAQRRAQASAWWERLSGSARQVYLYQVFPSRVEADLLLWSAEPVEEQRTPARFFERFARAINDCRALFQPVLTLWGFTRPSIYAAGRSPQEIDPFDEDRKPYLIVYPFAKTAEWYQMSKDARQGMMNEHIRVGKQYPAIRQWLLYTFGLQDQEFVVVYETDDLILFSDLVQALRSTEARRYTLRDTPIFTAVHQTPEEILTLLG
ncbi:MAG: chlorite dismutase family protein [Candidatus Bathyarchaeia archaeon]